MLNCTKLTWACKCQHITLCTCDKLLRMLENQKRPASVLARAGTFIALLAVLCALAVTSVFFYWDWLSIALLGPTMFVFAAGESIPLAIIISLVYIPLILAPTGIQFLQGKRSRPLLIFQALLLVPNFLTWIYAFAPW